MKTCGAAAVLICVTLLACMSEEDATSVAESADLAALAQVREHLAEAVRQGDLEGILATFDDSVVVMSPNEPPIIGLERARSWLEPYFSTPRPDATYESAELHVAGDWGFGRGSSWGGSGKRLWIFRRQGDGTWRISHIMWSSNSAPTESQ